MDDNEHAKFQAFLRLGYGQKTMSAWDYSRAFYGDNVDEKNIAIAIAYRQIDSLYGQASDMECELHHIKKHPKEYGGKAWKTALRDAYLAGYQSAREQAAGVAADHDDGSSTPGPLAAWTIAEAIRKMEPSDA